MFPTLFSMAGNYAVDYKNLQNECAGGLVTEYEKKTFKSHMLKEYMLLQINSVFKDSLEFSGVSNQYTVASVLASGADSMSILQFESQKSGS
jgi:hypothetical protein